MNRSDILTTQISEDMRAEGKKFASAISSINNKHTLDAYNKRDYIGSLGHQAVENIMHSKNLYFESNTGVQIGPDKYDILFSGDKIDVKSSHKNNYDIEKWWKYQNFLVLEHQIKRGVLQQKDSLVFCIVDGPRDSVHIFGGIQVNEFLRKAQKVGPKTHPHLKWDNRQIKVHQLKPFWEFIYRV